MSTKLSAADEKYLSDSQKQKVIAAKNDWAEAYAAGDTGKMQAANAAAEAVRAEAVFSVGCDGNLYIPTAG